METFILIGLAFAAGWFLGSIWTTIRQAMAFQSILKELGITTEQLIDLRDRVDPQPEPTSETVVEITLEQHDDVIYAYRKTDSQFLAQGTDRDTLIDHLNKTFANGARLIIREEDGAHLVKTL